MMKLDPDRTARIFAAVRGLLIAAASAAMVFGLSAEKSTAAAAIGSAIITMISAVFVRSALAPTSQGEDTYQELVSGQVTELPVDDASEYQGD
jgi:hypothetical protein